MIYKKCDFCGRMVTDLGTLVRIVIDDSTFMTCNICGYLYADRKIEELVLRMVGKGC